MTIYYVSTTGSDANTGLSPTQAWLTPKFALQTTALPPGSIVKIAPGTYLNPVYLVGIGPTTSGTPHVGVDPHEYDATTWITVMRDDAYPLSSGPAIIDGTGSASCMSFFGKAYWKIDGLTFTNDGGHPTANPQAFGIQLVDAATDPVNPGNNNGCHDFIISNCTFTGINRPLPPLYGGNGLANPVAFISYADEVTYPTKVGCHHILITGNTFTDCRMSSDTYSNSFCVGAGNASDIGIIRNDFYNTIPPVHLQLPSPISQGGVGYSDCHGCIEFAGNYITQANPAYPRRLVISENMMDMEQTNMAGAVYPNACQQVLVERNYVRNIPYPFGFQAESVPPTKIAQSDEIWCRNNIVNGGEWCVYGVSLGAYSQPADIYQDVKRISITNNTLSSDRPLTLGYAMIVMVNNQTPPHTYGNIGVESSCFVLNNLIRSSGNAVSSSLPTFHTDGLDYNLYALSTATPFYWANVTVPTATLPYDASQEHHSQQVSYATTLFQPGYTGSDAFHLIDGSPAQGAGTNATPAWYTPGVFGYYEPAVELDFYGEPRGAVHDIGAAIYRNPEDLFPLAVRALAVSLGANEQAIVPLASDPTTTGMGVPIGSLGMQANGSMWAKYGAGFTAWRQLVDTALLAGGAVPFTGLIHAQAGIEIGVAGSAKIFALSIDPRLGSGLDAPRGSLGVISGGGRRLFFKYGSATTQWIPTDEMAGGIWPPILDTISAADVTAELATIIAGITAAPVNLVQFDEVSGAAIDYVAGENLVSTGGDATRVLTSFKNGRLDRAAHSVDGSASYWQAQSTTAWKTPGTTAFAYIMIMKGTAASGSYILSEYKQSGQARGFHLGFDAAGNLTFGINGSLGVSALASLAVDHLDAWHVVICGRSITGGTIHVCSDLGDGTAPSGAMGDISNTDATFLIGADLFGTRSSGMTGDTTCLARFTGAGAEAVLANRVALCTSLAGGTITGATVIPSTFQMQGVATPAAISGAQNNYSPFNLTMASIIRQDLSAAASITGLAGGSEGRVITIFNIATVQARTLTITHDGAGSTAANRFYLPNGLDWIIPIHGCATFMYDLGSSRWRMVGVATNNFPSGTLGVPGIVVGNDIDHGIYWDGSSPKLVSDGAFAMSWGGPGSGGAGSTGFNGTMLTGTIFSAGTLILSSDTTPTAIAGAQNNYAFPAGATCMRQDCSAAASLTGLTGGSDGLILTIQNISAVLANTLTLVHESASSTAANRFTLPSNANVVINAGGSVTLRYDSTSSRWRVIGGAA